MNIVEAQGRATESATEHQSDKLGKGPAGDGPEGGSTGASAASASASQPPPADRGVDTALEALRAGRGKPAVGLDWLTVTTGSGASAALEGWTLLEEPGNAQAGFTGSERRTCMGGHCWRKMGPRCEEKRFGREYESWEWSGSDGGHIAATWLRGRDDVKPTRVDVAFDFHGVPDGLRAETIAAAWAPHLAANRIKPGVNGEGDDFTVYAGSRKSDFRVKCYRKDLKDAGWLLDLGRTLRIELTMKGKAAEAWWQSWQRSQAEAWAVAGGHVLRLTGLQMQTEIADALPLEDVTPASEFAQMVFEFVDQYASMLDAADYCGVDLQSLVRERMLTWTRMTQHRHIRRLKLCEGLDARTVERRALAMMAARRLEQARA